MANSAEVGIASHYSTKTGTRTASGEKLVDSRFTAAHKTLKFGTLVKVTNLKNKKTTVVKITDRGPYTKNRVLDVSQAAAKQLGFHQQGITQVKIEVVNPPKQKQINNTKTRKGFILSAKSSLSKIQNQVIGLWSAMDLKLN